MRSCSVLRALAVLVLVVLSGCGNLPRPFQPDIKANDNPLLLLKDGAGVVVRPIADLPDGEAAALAESLATALRETNIPAATRGGNAESYIVQGQLEEPPGSRLRDVTFELRDPLGRLVGSHRTTFVAASDMNLTTPKGWEPVAGAVATAMANMIQPASTAAKALPRRVALAELNGLPAARGRAVVRSLEFSLRRERIEMATSPSKETVNITGDIRVSPRGSTTQLIEVEWVVTAPGGREIGKVNQSNEVPSAMIERAWGEVAAAIGEGAAEGIIDLIEKGVQ